VRDYSARARANVAALIAAWQRLTGQTPSHARRHEA